MKNNPSDLAINRLTGKNEATPRTAQILKTHDLPKESVRFIYLIRDGRSAIMSYYYYLRNIAGLHLSLEDVIVGNAPAGSWSNHVRAWTEKLRGGQSILLRFEDFTQSPSVAVKELSRFLDREPHRAFTRTFGEMHKADPMFFRVGKNRTKDFTFEQSRLFNEHHAAVMREFSYDI